MFLCDKCHDPEKCWGMSRSYGRCEMCAQTASCIDCHMRDNRCMRTEVVEKKPDYIDVELEVLPPTPALPSTIPDEGEWEHGDA